MWVLSRKTTRKGKAGALEAVEGMEPETGTVVDAVTAEVEAAVVMRVVVSRTAEGISRNTSTRNNTSLLHSTTFSNNSNNSNSSFSTNRHSSNNVIFNRNKTSTPGGRRKQIYKRCDEPGYVAALSAASIPAFFIARPPGSFIWKYASTLEGGPPPVLSQPAPTLPEPHDQPIRRMRGAPPLCASR